MGPQTGTAYNICGLHMAGVKLDTCFSDLGWVFLLFCFFDLGSFL